VGGEAVFLVNLEAVDAESYKPWVRMEGVGCKGGVPSLPLCALPFSKGSCSQGDRSEKYLR